MSCGSNYPLTSRQTRVRRDSESLSQQVLMYVSVSVIRVALPVADIVAGDRELFEAFDVSDRDRAIALWQVKIEESRRGRCGGWAALRRRPRR